MNITGTIMVFRKDFDGKPSYSIGISKKIGEKYESAFMPVNFRKGVDVGNKTKIDIVKAWPSWYEGKNGKVHTWFVDEFNVIAGQTEIPTGFSQVEDDEFPLF